MNSLGEANWHWFDVSPALIDLMRRDLAHHAGSSWISELLRDEDRMREIIQNAVEGAVSAIASKRRMVGPSNTFLIAQREEISQEFLDIVAEHLPFDECALQSWAPALLKGLNQAFSNTNEAIGVGDGHLRSTGDKYLIEAMK